MTPDRELEWLAHYMNKLPFVTWDRCVRTPVEITAYGWIAREDGRSDFVLVVFWPASRSYAFWTSSASRSEAIFKLLTGEDEGHTDCERVEDVFGGLVERKVVLG